MKSFLQKIILLLSLLNIFGVAVAQNILNSGGVEQGNLNAWQAYTGTSWPTSTATQGFVAGRHTLVTGSNVDYFSNLPTVPTTGNNFAIKLGDSIGGAQAERMTFGFKVTNTNYFLQLAYSAVLKSTSIQSSAFVFNVLDTFGNPIFTNTICAACNNTNPTNLITSPVDASVSFTPWVFQNINLLNKIGDSVIIEITSYDDGSGSGFGYGYFDITQSNQLKITEQFCANNPYVTLMPPAGFATYAWYNNTNVFISNVQNLQITNPQLGDSVYVVLTPAIGNGIIDTIGRALKLDTFPVPYNDFTTLLTCDNLPVQFTNAAVSADSIVQYEWNFADNSSSNNTSNLENPVHQFTSNGLYNIQFITHTITGCVDTLNKMILVSQAPQVNAGADLVYCKNQVLTLGANPTAIGGSFIYFYNWQSPQNIYFNTNSIANPTVVDSINFSAIVLVTDTVSKCYNSDTVNYTVDNSCTNNAPVAVLDNNLHVNLGNSIIIQVLNNDIDNDGIGVFQGNLNTANVVVHQGLQHNTGALNIMSNRDFIFTPNTSYLGVDTFSYIVFDNGSPNLSDTTIVIINIYDTLKANAGNSLAICNANPTAYNNLVVTGGSQGVKYNWTPSLGISCTTCANPIISASTNTVYTIQIIDSLSVDTFIVNLPVIIDNINVSLGNDLIIDDAPNVTLSATISGNIGSNTFSWNSSGSCTNCSNPTYSPNAVTLYIVTVTDSLGCSVQDSITVFACSIDCVYPGDANNNDTVNNVDVLQIGLGYGIAGPVRFNNSIIYTGHYADNYGSTINNIDFKFADCNGDGLVDATDTQAIVNNYMYLHNNAMQAGNNDPAISVTLPTGILQNGDPITIQINLGDNLIPASNIYGISYTINLDQIALDTNSIQFQSLNNSFLFNSSTDNFGIAKYQRKSGKIHTGFSRINHVSKSGFGPIAIVNADINTDNVIGKEQQLAIHKFVCTVSDITAVNELGQIIPLKSISDTANVQFETGIKNLISADEINIIPNPANTEIHIASRNAIINEIIITDMVGKCMIKNNSLLNTKSTSLDTKAFEDGYYIVYINTNKGNVIKKLVVQH